ncbi:hypothetical protein KSP40_PGU022346 [Platanthera guangdongensis]|uniref:U-box domain-containing protein n=1 Tax=Platanthera guangdongensis TaxID=2320717 RepID=A0ABR2LFE8_9ASPA
MREHVELLRRQVGTSGLHFDDREEQLRWIASGHRTCPNSGQILGNAYLVPNYALSCLISHWCRENGVPCDSQASSGGCGIPAASKAEAIEKGDGEGRKDAAMALFNLSTHPENWERMVVSGAVAALVGAVRETRGGRGSRRSAGSARTAAGGGGDGGVGEQAVVGLAGVMSAGSARGREMLLRRCTRSAGEEEQRWRRGWRGFLGSPSGTNGGSSGDEKGSEEGGRAGEDA